jgi:hypothetical protein
VYAAAMDFQKNNFKSYVNSKSNKHAIKQNYKFQLVMAKWKKRTLKTERPEEYDIAKCKMCEG